MTQAAPRELFPYQADVLGKTRTLISEGRIRLIWQAPTASGKTIMATALTGEAVADGKRVIFCVSHVPLIDQTVEKFLSEGIEGIGVIQGDHPLASPSAPVQICSIQTLANRCIPSADLVFIDEVHRWHDTYAAWIEDPAWSHVPFIGMSATPWREGLADYFDDVVTVATTRELIRLGYLCPFRVFAPSHPDLSKVKTLAGDYDLAQLSALMSSPARVRDIARTDLKLGEDRAGFCFCVSRAHAKAVRDAFLACGIPTAYIDCETARDEREAIKAAFHSGDVRIVCNVGVLTTGIDWDVRIIILARPTNGASP
jgi:DNA repair protein RadD